MSENSLLPNNASHFEEALEASFSRELPNVLSTIWQPATCPEHLLPWLAWGLAVDEWDDNWSEQIKRQVCQNSVEIHKFKGTKHAIKLALNSLNASVDLEEWFENGGQPYTASLVAYASDNLGGNGDTLLTPELQDKLWKVVKRAKNVRTHIDFKVGVSVKTGLHVSAHSTNLIIHRKGLTLV